MFSKLKKWLERKVQMKALTAALDAIWSLKILTGYRTKIAQGWFVLAAAVGAYQEMATNQELIAQGVDLPDIPTWVILSVLPAISVWMAAKVKQFSVEHK